MTTYILTPAFCKAKLLKQHFEHLKRESVPGDSVRIVIDNHYPVDKEKNREEIKQLAKENGAILLDPGKDIGLHGAHNLAIKEFSMKDEDIILGIDPDDRPSTGSIMALNDVILSDPKIDILGLCFSVIRDRMEQGHLVEYAVNEYRVWRHKSVEMWNVCAQRMRFINSIGGFGSNAVYYGGHEAQFHCSSGGKMNLCYLADYNSEGAPVDRSDTTLFDPEYRLWKNDYVAQEFKGSFEDWLKNKGDLK